MRQQQYKYYTERHCGTPDDMSSQHDGNQLKKVTNQCDDLTYAGAMDFNDGADMTTEYEWDANANGNMTRDRNKGIWDTRYNELNLPERIKYTDNHIVRYTCAADGRKLRVDYFVSNMAVIGHDTIMLANSGPAAGLMGGILPTHPTLSDFPFIPPETTLMTMDYCGNHVYRNGVLERTMNDYGYQAHRSCKHRNH